MRLRSALLLGLVCSFGLLGCSEEAKPAGSASASAKPAPKPSTTTSAAAPAPSASAAPLPDRSDCPKDSKGPGTLEKPCEGKGEARMMEVKWNGKIDDKGPYFNVTNKSPAVILYGKIAVYFYDKDGKQLPVKDAAAPDKTLPFQTCFGNIFSGVMKVNEKALLTFSCVKKEVVPEGTVAIEAEMLTVGFSDSSEKKSEFYWTNRELAPEVRKKGGK